MKTSPNAQTGLGWALWAVAAALPWLLPNHAAPWTLFQGEAASGALFLAPAVWVLLRGGTRWRVGLPAAVFGGLAVVPLLQAAAGLFVWPGEALWPSLYLAGVAAVLLVAGQAERVAPGRLVEVMWAGLVVAALASTGLALYQWVDLSSLGVLVAPASASGRIIANVGQPNLLASLLVWGLLGVWWGFERRRIGGAAAVLAAAFLLLGVVMTQSRTGWLEVGLVALLALTLRRPLGSARHRVALIALALWFVVLVLAWVPLNEWLAFAAVRPAADQASAGKRPAIWWLMLQASALSPWFGFGFNQGIQAYAAVAERFAPLHVIVQHSHNLVLDLIVWTGWPLGLLLSLGIAAWFLRIVRRLQSAGDALMLMGLVTLLAHALLELPHCLFLFLGPAAVLAGTLDARQPTRLSWQAPRWLVAVLLLVPATLLSLLVLDYQKVEADLGSWRLRQARIGDLRVPPPPALTVLQPLQQALLALRTPPRRNMPADELAALRRAVQRYPSDAGLFALARASALNGRPEDAAQALRRLCIYYPPANCRSAASAWQDLAGSGQPELLAVRLPPEFTPSKGAIESIDARRAAGG